MLVAVFKVVISEFLCYYGILKNNKGTASRLFITDHPSHLKRMEISHFGHGRAVDEIINARPRMENHSLIANVGKGILSGS